MEMMCSVLDESCPKGAEWVAFQATTRQPMLYDILDTRHREGLWEGMLSPARRSETQ